MLLVSLTTTLVCEFDYHVRELVFQVMPDHRDQKEVRDVLVWLVVLEAQELLASQVPSVVQDLSACRVLLVRLDSQDRWAHKALLDSPETLDFQGRRDSLDLKVRTVSWVTVVGLDLQVLLE